MTRGQSTLRGIAGALVFAVAMTVFLPAHANTAVTLTADQLLQAAGAALRSGDPTRSLAYSEALVQRDPGDFSAQLIRARSLRDLGRNVEARNAAREARKTAKTTEEKYAAAMVTAQVQSSSGRKTISQLWLRRAVELAPSKKLEYRAIRDFKYVRATNPWSTRLSFSITPDSNINDGSASDTSFLNYALTESLFGEPVEYQLTGAAKALPGIQYKFGLDTRYRFRQTQTQAQDLYLQTEFRTYTLTDPARAPGVSGSDFNFGSVFVGYGHRFLSPDHRNETTFRADLGQSWYSDNPYARYTRFALRHSRILDNRTQFGGGLSGERQIGITTADVNTIKLDGWGGRTLPSGNKLFMSLTGAWASSPLPTEEFLELHLRGSLVSAKPILGATTQFGIGLRSRDYSVSVHSPNGRHDQEIRLDMTLVFNQLDYSGFNPTITFFGSRKNSNISLYDSNKLGVQLGVQSAF